MRARDAARLACLPLALGMAWAALRHPALPPAFRTDAACQSGRIVTDHVAWRPGPARAAGVPIEADLVSSGVLGLQVCRAGTLRFLASGTPAAGQDPVLTVALGNTPLLETRVRGPRPVRLRIARPGWVSFGFPNDLYRPPQDRNLYLRQLTFTPD